MSAEAAVRRKVIERCAQLAGVLIGKGAFAPGAAVWVGQREVAHFDSDGALDVRLTRGLIRVRRAQLKADPRISLRASSSDWLEASVATTADIEFAVGLVADAVAANQPTVRPGPPPTGAALARRRRFH